MTSKAPDSSVHLNLLDRRQFNARALLALLGGITVTVAACSDGSPTAPTTPANGDAAGTVSANHGHTAVIDAARLAAGGAIVLDIRGTANHLHTVQLSAAEVTQIANRQRVSKESSTGDAHTHLVTFN